MAKKALCVGINNYPGSDGDLKGCVNDANDWATLLTSKYDFDKSDVQMLTDRNATKKSMVAGLKDLFKGAASGDVLVFTNSSHGSYLPDRSSDEPDTYDEVICPYDYADNILKDDEIRELVAGLGRGVRLSVISDSCHSGSVTRVAVSDVIPGFRPRDDRRIRFLSPYLIKGAGRQLRDPVRSKPKRYRSYPESRMREVLLSGCTDEEVSYDAKIGTKYHGAMSYFALKAIKDANYKITWSQLGRRIAPQLVDAGYFQHPQVQGKTASKNAQIFT